MEARTSVHGMVIALIELALILAVIAIIWIVGSALWTALGQNSTAPPLPSRQRTELAAAVSRARWVPAHDEVDGTTRILVRRTYTGLDGLPAVLDERVLETFPAQDPAWEAHFTEGMSNARYRCAYLNAEESQ